MDKKDMLIKNLHKTSNACKVISNMEQSVRIMLKARGPEDETIQAYIKEMNQRVNEIIILKAEREAFAL